MITNNLSWSLGSYPNKSFAPCESPVRRRFQSAHPSFSKTEPLRTNLAILSCCSLDLSFQLPMLPDHTFFSRNRSLHSGPAVLNQHAPTQFNTQKHTKTLCAHTAKTMATISDPTSFLQKHTKTPKTINTASFRIVSFAPNLGGPAQTQTTYRSTVQSCE